MAIANRPQIYDFLIVGGDLTGLLIAHALETTGLKIALLEEQEQMGSFFRPFVHEDQNLSSHIMGWAATTETQDLFTWLEGQISSTVMGDLSESRSLILKDGKLVPFLGFNDCSFKSLDSLSLYNQNNQTSFFSLKSTPHEWTNYLAHHWVGEQINRAIVTQIERHDSNLKVTINNSSHLIAHRLIFTAPPQHLLKIFTEKQLSTRIRQRIAKSKWWTSVSLHFVHSYPLVDHSNVHFLFNPQDEWEPTLGHFITPAVTGEPTTSLWMNLFSPELSEDPESIAQILREMKKRIKKAYPTFLDSVLNEKLIVRELSHGNIDLGLKEEGILPEWDQIYLAHHTLTGREPVLGSLQSAKQALNWASPAQKGVAVTPRGSTDSSV